MTQCDRLVVVVIAAVLCTATARAADPAAPATTPPPASPAAPVKAPATAPAKTPATAPAKTPTTAPVATAPAGGEVDAEASRLIGQLDDDNWKTRERAEAELLAIGPPILPRLKELVRRGGAPSVVSVADSLVKRIEEAGSTGRRASASTCATPRSRRRSGNSRRSQA